MTDTAFWSTCEIMDGYRYGATYADIQNIQKNLQP